ncbi:hypothetical protein [Shewanella dokdonensis]|uniref:DUF3795 domain-containing protein n=1 Tax=Shewanella dokdonensis TaxID=712036 RepID=A0ABX8DJH7_9GAMM|nr:hypothetical protein [Shewanella dokdonensis]MCL1075791.1 hypothetical protein [Shewanella dokdonensis]QVK24141.1 hypothetical protein KHX94_06005 [Shewanella dokdonensis]
MAIYCDPNCYSCCDHCTHFCCLVDKEDLDLNIEYAGVCTLHSMPMDIDELCGDFFCRAAKDKGIGYFGIVGEQSKGPYVLDAEFFAEHELEGWIFKA